MQPASEIIGSSSLLAQAGAALPALIEEPVGVLAVLLTVLALVFWSKQRPWGARLFNVIPAVVFCYFVPTTLSGLGLIPSQSPLYDWVKEYILPSSLLLLTLSLDVPGILRLGPKAGVMLLAGTAGVVLGGPIALLIWQSQLPQDAWRQMAYLAGSWIGGGANAVALQRTFGASDASISPIIVVDVALSNLWTGVLLYLAGRHARIDRWLGGDASAMTRLEHRMAEFERRVARTISLADLLTILALGFGLTWLAHVAGQALPRLGFFARMEGCVNAFAWKIILVGVAGVALSFTRLRSLEGAGASKFGTAMMYLLIASIGAGADFRRLLHGEAGYFLALAVTWMAVHVAVVLAVGKLIRAPLFFIAVGSQANIGGAASAPIVASAFNPVLAPVGVLLAIAGYVVGTYGGLLCVNLCRWTLGGSSP